MPPFDDHEPAEPLPRSDDTLMRDYRRATEDGVQGRAFKDSPPCVPFLL
jgi:hypothetical protein